MAHPAAFALHDHPVEIFILAVVLAPVLEESVFRVFHYGFFRRFFRVRQAALVTGLAFAVLHPQGNVALPYLTILGAGLCIIREYRPGATAAIVCHATVNAIALSGAYFLL